jgi:Squalene-hopene cyclase C-terminal domain/Prenyltransferase and squalene oxidase repeat
VIAVKDLMTGLLAQPNGQISPSVYETGRVVALAPWLSGQDGRWEFLLRCQHPDGSWGGPGEYRLVPTLSATEAILTSIPRDRPGPVTRDRLRRAGGAGLRALFEMLGSAGSVQLPDTVAVELIVPQLIEKLNGHLAADRDSPWGSARLPMPRNLDTAKLAKIRMALGAGAAIPVKLAQSLEIAGSMVSGAPSVTACGGAVGCAPAATAAWLADEEFRGRHRDSVGYLEALAARHGGPVPTVIPITEFERAWVLSDLVRGGTDVPVPQELVDGLAAAVSDGATAGGPGMPPDADTTSATLFTLARLGRHRTPDCLFDYERDTHFCCWHGERTFSPTANAHVLEAFAEHLAHRPPHAGRYRAAIRKIARWLRECQQEDGSWTDKWHASPYYATACCVQALYAAGGGRPGAPAAPAAVRRAVAWVLATQRPDGSWGRWTATGEETAYALRILIAAGTPQAHESVARGCAFLHEQEGRFDLPPLWHGKDLYTPAAIVQAAILATLTLARHRQPLTGRIAG